MKEQDLSIRRRRTWYLGTSVIVFFIFSGAYSLLSDASRLDNSDGRVIFIVAQADKSTALPGVEVSIVGKSGIESVGFTDLLGQVEVDREALTHQDSLAVLFCLEGFFCGAFRLDEPHFHRFEEHYITLAVIEVI